MRKRTRWSSIKNKQNQNSKMVLKMRSQENSRETDSSQPYFTLTSGDKLSSLDCEIAVANIICSRNEIGKQTDI